MAEAVFAGKKIEKLPRRKTAAFLAAPGTILARLFEYFFMGNRPGNTGNGNGQYKKPAYLQRY